jgi:hypothetical protein
MSLHKLTAGSGYDYLTRQVAAMDATDKGHVGLASYYTEKGETPGVWVGSGMEGIDGLDAGDVVTADHMQNLFGAGHHPLATERTKELDLRLGRAGIESPTEADYKAAARLGTPYKVYENDISAFRIEVAKRLAAVNETAGLPGDWPVPAAERARIRTEVAREFFKAEYGREPADARELAATIAKHSRPKTNAVALEEVWDTLAGPYSRHARPGARVGIICVTDDRSNAELTSLLLSSRLEAIGVATHLRLWADGERWHDFNSGTAGLQTQEAADRMATTTILAGSVQPAASRTSLADSLVGDHEPIAQALETARAAAAASTPRAERDWAQDRLAQFHADGNRLPDVEGARLLVALETMSTRDALWEDMNTQNTRSHIASWTDLTRRAPDEVRAAPASMLGFASWLHGDGARAWCALDQVPADRPYSMAAIVASAVQNGLHPNEWERHQAQLHEISSQIDEGSVPTPPNHRARREVPRTQPTTDRPAPGR